MFYLSCFFMAIILLSKVIDPTYNDYSWFRRRVYELSEGNFVLTALAFTYFNQKEKKKVWSVEVGAYNCPHCGEGFEILLFAGASRRQSKNLGSFSYASHALCDPSRRESLS